MIDFFLLDCWRHQQSPIALSTDVVLHKCVEQNVDGDVCVLVMVAVGGIQNPTK